MSITKLQATATDKELTAGAQGAAGNSTGADVKELANALIADAAASEDAVNELIDVAESMTLSAAIASTTIKEGMELTISDRGDATFNVVLASGVTPNTFDVVQCTGDATLALELVITDSYKPKAFGAKGDYNTTTKVGTDDTLAIQACLNSATTGGVGKLVEFDKLDYLVDTDGLMTKLGYEALGPYKRASDLSIDGKGATIHFSVAGGYIINDTVGDEVKIVRLNMANITFDMSESSDSTNFALVKTDNESDGSSKGAYSQGWIFTDVKWVGKESLTQSGVVLECLGEDLESEMTFNNCRASFLRTLFKVDNAESFNNTFYNTHAERMYGYIFDIEAGGSINVFGGSYITERASTQKGGFARFGGDEGVGALSAGTTFTFNGIRLESRSANSVVLEAMRWNSPVTINFSECWFGKFDLSTTLAKLKVNTNIRLNFDKCTLPNNNAIKAEFFDNAANDGGKTFHYDKNVSLVVFDRCARAYTNEGITGFPTDFSALASLTGSSAHMTVKYRGCTGLGLPDCAEVIGNSGSALSSSYSSSIIPMKMRILPFSSSGTAQEESMYPKITLPLGSFIKDFTVSSPAVSATSDDWGLELVDEAEFTAVGTGTVYATTGAVPFNAEVDFTAKLNTRLYGDEASRTLYIRQVQSTLVNDTTAKFSSNSIAYFTVI
ncbi:MAG: hypothetical protein GY738_04940 [Pseudoalteromonas sp.]|nr:hypothetical protein [Pseudoalteromonas sp.]